MDQAMKGFLDEVRDYSPTDGFRPDPYYEAESDTLMIYLRNEDCYSVRLSSLITLHLSFEDDTLVGCDVKGVAHMLELIDAIGDWEGFSVAIHDSKIKLGILLAFSVSKEEPEDIDQFRRAFTELRDCEVDRNVLKQAA